MFSFFLAAQAGLGKIFKAPGDGAHLWVSPVPGSLPFILAGRVYKPEILHGLSENFPGYGKYERGGREIRLLIISYVAFILGR